MRESRWEMGLGWLAVGEHSRWEKATKDRENRRDDIDFRKSRGFGSVGSSHPLSELLTLVPALTREIAG